MSCDPQTLVNEASCLECGIPVGMQLPILIALFCQILANGGTGGGSSNLYGFGSPAGVVNATATAQIYFDFTVPGQPGMWVSEGPGTGSWSQLLGN